MKISNEAAKMVIFGVGVRAQLIFMNNEVGIPAAELEAILLYLTPPYIM